MEVLANFFLVFLLCIPTSLADPIVSTTAGEVRGEYQDILKVNQFLGIPYAQQKRFQAPESYPSWTEVRNATGFGADCPQMYTGFGDKFAQSEDCLFLDVYSPSTATPSSNLNVMVWIHGGGYTSGSGRLYPGTMYASKHDIVVVSINYRLGILGFFNVPGTDTKGNYGMLDQIMALNWVKDNIKNFGGDPQNVTVFGESAGSSSISLLGVSPLTKGLFKQAIMESGSAVADWAYAYPDDEAPKKLAKVLQCPENTKTDIIRCIKGKSVKDILTAQLSFLADSIVRPSVDNYFLTDSPRKLLETGNFFSMPVMMGTNINEGNYFLPGYQPYVNGSLANGMSKLELESYIKYLLLKDKLLVQEAVVFEYSDNDCLEADCPLNNRQLACDTLSDLMFNAAVDFELRARSQGAQVYSYLYSYEGTTTWLKYMPNWVGTTHGSELEYVLGVPMFLLKNFTNNDRKVSEMMMKSWANFAKTGDPNHAELGVTWPKFTNIGVNGRSYLTFNLTPTVETLYRTHKLAFLNSYIHNLRNEEIKKCPKDTSSSARSSINGDVILVILIMCACVITVLNL